MYIKYNLKNFLKMKWNGISTYLLIFILYIIYVSIEVMNNKYFCRVSTLINVIKIKWNKFILTLLKDHF